MDRSLLYLQSVDINQLKKQARELLNGYRSGQVEAIEAFARHCDPDVPPELAKLADAQRVLARSFDYPNWPRLKLAGELINAIRQDDPARVCDLIDRNPRLLTENVFGLHSNWGPPLSVASQLDTPAVFAALLERDGQDLTHAFGRAALQGQTDRARRLLARGAQPAAGEIMGPCETLNVEGMRLLVECGVPFEDESGNALGPVGLLLEGYLRNPEGKHACLAFCAEIGIEYPDTPMMAFHRGRIDLLEKHLDRDPQLPHRRFSYREIYPLEMGCHEDETLGLHGAPLAGTTLLHMAMDFDEVEIAHWLLNNRADVNAAAEVGSDGFGGHTPLFNLVVSQAYLSGRQREPSLARMLLKSGADPNHKASIRKGIRFVEDEAIHEYNDVTPVGFGLRFHHRRWVSDPAVDVIREFGGQ